MYDLYEEHFLIENDTTLRQIRILSKICPNGEHDAVVNNVYHFFKY